MLPFLDHLDMVYCEGMGIADDSIYQHDTLLDVICSTLLLLSMWIDTLIPSDESLEQG